MITPPMVSDQAIIRRLSRCSPMILVIRNEGTAVNTKAITVRATGAISVQARRSGARIGVQMFPLPAAFVEVIAENRGSGGDARQHHSIVISIRRLRPEHDAGNQCWRTC